MPNIQVLILNLYYSGNDLPEIKQHLINNYTLNDWNAERQINIFKINNEHLF